MRNNPKFIIASSFSACLVPATLASYELYFVVPQPENSSHTGVPAMVLLMAIGFTFLLLAYHSLGSRLYDKDTQSLMLGLLYALTLSLVPALFILFLSYSISGGIIESILGSLSLYFLLTISFILGASVQFQLVQRYNKSSNLTGAENAPSS